eukprot:CAMPEP_0179922014 /NCGR_PEP_ID=MMETSP0983-20121128/5378_1 /TAXON_ID=483367 /ORGANISM="non described non described, Strain CCMP 2436" /LENGTH=423 /DNA_ID=CAMNT_0021825263 /DNA_START=201 /DNA_END=1472 /DNA_ORIENTATION=-
MILLGALFSAPSQLRYLNAGLRHFERQRPTPRRQAGAMCDSQNGAGVPDFWLGVASSLIGSVVLNFGINLQRFAHLKLEKLPFERRVHYTQHPIWIGGFIIFLVGNLGDAVGLSFTPQSVITPIGSVSLVSNLLFARVLLKEAIGIPTLIGVFLIVGGVVTIVTTSNTACSVETIDTLLARWRRTDFIIFTVCHFFVLALLNTYVYGVERRMRAESEGTTRCLADWQGRRLRVAYAILASMYATWTVLLIKSIGELVKETFRGNNQLLRWETYMILLGALFSAPSQLRYLNAGLRHFEALFIVPVFYAFWVFGSITVGGIYFDEFVGFKHWQYGVFAAGVVINVGGVAVLASRSLSSPVEPPLTPVHTRIAVSTTSTKDEIPQQPSAERTFFSYMPSLPWTTQRTPAVPDPGAATQRSSTSTV